MSNDTFPPTPDYDPTAKQKARAKTSRIMPKSSPGARSVYRILNLRYWFFRKPSGPATILG